ncbi:Uncharacterised protein [Klebsiella pneumoniae]|nr:Uncharacterised protein [Klebsiella pneumoniae]
MTRFTRHMNLTFACSGNIFLMFTCDDAITGNMHLSIVHAAVCHWITFIDADNSINVSFCTSLSNCLHMFALHLDRFEEQAFV